MTAQIEDRFFLNRESCHLKTDLSRLIHPNNWGMEPTMMHTACWRGYHGVIRVEKNTLFLDALTVNTKNGEYNQINDKMPTQQRSTVPSVSSCPSPAHSSPHETSTPSTTNTWASTPAPHTEPSRHSTSATAT